jgi:nicotinamide-nucleotide amidase
MIHLLDGEIVPRLRARAGLDRVVRSRLIRTWGLPESKVGEMLDDLFQSGANPSIAFLASAGEIKVRITAAGAAGPEVDELIAPVEAVVRERLGSAVFGADQQTIETVVHDLLRARSWTIGTAESATAGLVAARLTSLPGASEVFRGGIVAYATDVKADLLGVKGSDPIVSEPVALQMAAGARTRLGCDVGVAVTGSAGPDPQEQPPGTMIVAVATPEGAMARTFRLPGDRERVRTYAATAALHLTRLAVAGDWWT